jgi:hypothetical protein
MLLQSSPDCQLNQEPRYTEIISYLLKSYRGVGVIQVLVGVMDNCLLAIGFLYLKCRCIFINTEKFIVTRFFGHFAELASDDDDV